MNERLQSYFIPEEAEVEVTQESLTEARIEQERALENAHSLSLEVQRLIDTEIGLEQLNAVVDNNDFKSQGEQDLIRVASQLAFTGSELDGEMLFPSMESKVSASTGALKDVISKIWQIVIKTVEKIWELLVKFFKKVSYQLEPLIKQNDNMRVRMGEASTKKVLSDTVKLERDAGKLSIDGKTPTGAADILTGLSRYSQIGEIVFVDYFKRLNDTGEKLAALIQAFDLSKPERSLDSIYQAASAFDLNAVKNGLGEYEGERRKDARFKGAEVFSSLPLAGNKSLFFVSSTAQSGDSNVLSSSEVSRQRRIQLEATKSSLKDNLSKTTIRTIQSGDGVKIYQQNQLILFQIKEFLDTQEKNRRIQKKLKTAGKKLEKASKKAGDDIPESSAVYVKEALRYVATFSEWSLKPSADLTSQMLATVRASISVCNKSAAVHG